MVAILEDLALARSRSTREVVYTLFKHASDVVASVDDAASDGQPILAFDKIW